jgi:hopanoid biosynthesis associated protein HpnK
LSSRKQLIVNADDFGFTSDVNEGVVEAHRSGILTATTLMANGEAFEDAVSRAREAPALDIGCHVVLVGGHSLLPPHRPLPQTVAQLLKAVACREIRVYDEITAQVRRICAAGIRPSHIDTHKHTHLAPPVLEAVARVAEEFGIRWVRRPFDLPMNALRGTVPRLKRLTSDALGVFRARFHRVLERRHCVTTDHFAGFQITGRFRTDELIELLRILPEGTTELMCHPGRCRETLRNAHTRLKESRECELEALISPGVRRAIERHGIELTSYRQLSCAGANQG